MVVLVTYKKEKDPIKNEGTRVTTSLYVNFPNIEGRITPLSMIGSGRNSDSFKHLCMSSLPAKMKIQFKMKALEWPQYIPIVCLLGIFQTLKDSLLCSLLAYLAEIQIMSRVYCCPCYLQTEEDAVKN